MEFSPLKTELLVKTPIVFVDAGARGDLEGIWRTFSPGTLKVIAFEPDPDAEVDWENEKKDYHLVRSALWSTETQLTIHIGRVPSASSVWPPNTDYLENFADAHRNPRITEKTVYAPAKTLDAISRELSLKPDFLKIDTQGAELQILQGASETLADSAFGTVVETWTAPVHKGQGLSHEVMQFMYEKGFGLFQVEIAAAWDRKIVETFAVSHRRQIVGLDLLFFKEPRTIITKLVEPGYAAKFAITTAMYGHYDLAVDILTLAIENGATERDALAALRQELIEAFNAQTVPRTEASKPGAGLIKSLMQRIWKKRPASALPSQKLHY